VRFSSVLLLSLGYFLLTRNSDCDPISDPVLGAIACNAAFGYYMARMFFAP
jgi:hypothetical protein